MTSTNIQDYDALELTFTVRTELFDAGRHPEDGEQMEGISYYVLAEAPSGVRWMREVGIIDVRVTDDDEWGYRTQDVTYINGEARPDVSKKDVEDTAATMAIALELSPTRRLNPTAWHYAGACYGSDAYCKLGIEEQTAADEREAEGWG